MQLISFQSALFEIKGHCSSSFFLRLTFESTFLEFGAPMQLMNFAMPSYLQIDESEEFWFFFATLNLQNLPFVLLALSSQLANSSNALIIIQKSDFSK